MAELTAGMRNNNPGNIKFVGQPGTHASVNTDQGDPQAVYANPQAGMNAMYQLLKTKWTGGRKTIRQLIAEQGGWTPGNVQAAENIARSTGVGLDDPIDFNNPQVAQKLMRGLLLQEHGQASATYGDDMLTAAITGGTLPQGGQAGQTQFPYRLVGGATRPDAISGFNSGFSQALLNMYQNAPPEVQRELALTSGFRDRATQERLWNASDKSGRTVARPGTSKHESGYAADLAGFGLKGGGNSVSQATRDWVKANAGNYGLYFPMDYEPWHIQMKATPSAGGGTGTPVATAAAGTGGTGGTDTGTGDANREILAALAAGKKDKPKNWLEVLGAGVQEAASAPLPQAKKGGYAQPKAALVEGQPVAPVAPQDPNRRMMLAQIMANLNAGRLY